LRAEDRAALPPRLAQAVDEVLPAVLAARARGPFEAGAWTVPAAALERHCDALGLVLARHRRPAARFTAWRRRGVLIAAVVVLGVLALRPWQSESFGPWRGTYFNRMDFTGQSEVRRDLDLDFEWGNGSPMDVIPNDRFSARWDTCLTIPTTRQVAFQLISDDGSRLEIDGALVIDNWGKHTATTRGATLELAAGEHHLHVEYFEERSSASLTLLASLDGEAPKPIPRTMLRAPDEGDENPCGE
ncbi:MAG TPA: PA14 domain-containing protein, partial [Nannocystis sp.]